MPVYTYRAVSPTGETKTGEIETHSPEDLASLLKENNLFLISCKRKKGPSFSRKAKTEELIQFFYSLGTMLKSSLPVLQAITYSEKNLKSKNLKNAVNSMFNLIQKGSSFSEAIERNRSVFPGFVLEPIRAAEATGKLPETMIMLAEQLKKNKEISGKVRKASIYPTFVVFFLMVLISIAINFVLPRVTGAINEIVVGDLPPITAFVLSVSDKVKIVAPYVPLFFLLLVAGYLVAGRIESARKVLDGLKIKVPYFREIVICRDIINILRVMVIAIESGLPMDKALAMAENSMENMVLKEKISNARAIVSTGELLSQALQSAEFDPYLDAMVISGETSGTLDVTLKNTLDYYDLQVSERIDRFFAYLEPLIIAFLGLIVLGVLSGALIPLWESMKYVGKM